MHRVKVRVVEDALDANNTIARANRMEFDRHAVTVVNLMSAPGSGKTTLLERTLGHWDDGPRIGVLEGDVAGSLDADRLAHHHIPVVQLNTDNGFGGECHLDANMVASAMDALPLDDIDILIVENVGNLVCPAEFRIGEDARIMVASVAEGDDKPLKYPLMFRACELVVINKIDLLEYVDFEMDQFLHHIDAVHPGVASLQVSARTGEGVDGLRTWLTELPARVNASAVA
ncbi:MAG: hydrogenase nickel incorporation protein HypB [Solirubrobacteraceae bacterium]